MMAEKYAAPAPVLRRDQQAQILVVNFLRVKAKGFPDLLIAKNDALKGIGYDDRIRVCFHDGPEHIIGIGGIGRRRSFLVIGHAKKNTQAA
jgi:hypothetical protein